MNQARPQAAGQPLSEHQEVLERLRTFGGNANSFLILYDGFRYFRSASGELLIGYIETATAWVAATEPLGPELQWAAAMGEFAESARTRGKTAVILPVGNAGARAAKRAGFGSILIGSEPKFDFTSYDPSPGVLQTARVFASKGGKVREFRPDETKGIHRQCEEITHEWLESRHMAPLDFLNRVAPWEQREHKKYFLVEQGGRVLAFVAAIPIFSRGGWYLIDVLRRSDSPAGSTELLMLEAMRLMKAQGAKEVSLGVSPLSNLHMADRRHHPFLYRILSFVFEHTNLFYRFKPLYEFKLKFRPSRWEPAYLVYSPGRLGPRTLRGLTQAMVPVGVVGACVSFLSRFFRRFDLDHFFRRQLSVSVICRSTPASSAEMLRRSLGAVGLAVAGGFNFPAPGLISRVVFPLLVLAYGSLLEWLGGGWLACSCFGLPLLLTGHWGAAFLGLTGGLCGFLKFLPALVLTAMAARAGDLLGSLQGVLIDICFPWILGFLSVRLQLGEFRPQRLVLRRPRWLPGRF